MAKSTLKESTNSDGMSDVEIVAKTPLSTLPASTSQKNIAATDILQFSPFVELNLTDPDEAIRVTLNPDEVVVGRFKVYFPDNYIPLYVRIFWIIVTCGLYLLVLLRREMERRRMCFGFCYPHEIYMKKGVMAVTNQGRAIVWEEHADQDIPRSGFFACCCKTLCLPCSCCFTCCVNACCKGLCDPPNTYKIGLKLDIYDLKQVRQVTSHFNSEACCSLFSFMACCCGCLDFSGCVRLDFNSFNQDHFSYTASAVTAFSRSYWMSSISAFLDTEGGGGSAAAAVPQFLEIISREDDKYANGDYKGVLADTFALHAQVMHVLSPLLPEVFRTDEGAGVEGGEGASKKKKKSTDVFSTKSDSQIVADDMTVHLPPGMLNLVPSEYVIDSMGIMYELSFWDWVITVCTLGLAYLLVYRKRKFSRTAIVLTNLRVFVVDIKQAKGLVPYHMTNFSLTTRSFLFYDVLAGSVVSESTIELCQMIFSWCLKPFYPNSNGKHIKVGLLSPSGGIMINYWVDRDEDVSFTKSLSKSCSQVDALPADVCEEITKLMGGSLTAKEEKLLPIDSSETFLGRHVDTKDLYKPANTNCCACNDTYVCSKKSIGPCFPILPCLLTCGLRPRKSREDIVVTDRAVYYLRDSSSNALGLPCAFDESGLDCVWIPANKLSAISMCQSMEGKESWIRRLCVCVCPVLCKMSKVKLEITMLSTIERDILRMPMFLALKPGLEIRSDMRVPNTLRALALVKVATDKAERVSRLRDARLLISKEEENGTGVGNGFAAVTAFAVPSSAPVPMVDALIDQKMVR
jgi:hypothetical protein